MTVNRGYEYREVLGPTANGQRLLDYLARRYVHSTPAEWEARILAGRVLLDSKPASPDTVLHRGQSLAWLRPPWREPDAPQGFAVLFEDDDLLAVAKPAGLPTLPGGGFLQSTLLHQARRRFPDAAPLHRLGRWTSGLVLFALRREAHVEMSRQWAAREVGKRYRALATGRPGRVAFTVDDPIGPVPHPLLGSVHAAAPDGKPATTHVAVLESRAEGFLCDVRIDTGRPHQIRIHLAAAGHPLVGDPLYASGGRPVEDCRALPGDPGYLLHGAGLEFRHPRTGARSDSNARLHRHFAATVEAEFCIPPRPPHIEFDGSNRVREEDAMAHPTTTNVDAETCPKLGQGASLERLAAARTLKVQQQVEKLEAFTGFETRNRYAVKDDSGNQVLFAEEEAGEMAEALSRFFLKAARPFTIELETVHGEPVVRVQRPFRFYFHELEVWNAERTFPAAPVRGTINGRRGSHPGFERPPRRESSWKPTRSASSLPMIIPSSGTASSSCSAPTPDWTSWARRAAAKTPSRWPTGCAPTWC